jgi:hypothetical protein
LSQHRRPELNLGFCRAELKEIQTKHTVSNPFTTRFDHVSGLSGLNGGTLVQGTATLSLPAYLAQLQQGGVVPANPES